MPSVRGARHRVPLGGRSLAGQAPARAVRRSRALFLETREHLDLDDLDADQAGDLGRMIVRLDRAIRAVGGIGRVYVNRWGDGGSHFHLWFYGRPVGDTQMLGFCLPLWAQILPPTLDDEWNRNLVVVAERLAAEGGTSMR